MAESTLVSAVKEQDLVGIEKQTSFCYEIVVKEELIIEDVLKPVEDDVQVKVESKTDAKELDRPTEDDGPSDNNQKSCEKCGRRFANNAARWRHSCNGTAQELPKSANGESLFCKECEKTFPNRYTFYQHNYRHRVLKEGKYRCETCDKRFEGKNKLTKHEQTVHIMKKKRGRKPLIKDSNELEQALKAVEKDENGFFKCPDCDERFEFRFKYNTHIRKHVALKLELYKCKTCDLLFKVSAELKRHEQAHEYHQARMSSDPFASIRPEATLIEENSIFKCAVCDKTFEQRRVALRHLMKHDHLKRERVQCNLCSLTFANKKYLEKHQAEHETKKDASSSESNSEKSVMDNSTMEKDSEFKCTICNKTFLKKRLLNQHIRRHAAINESKFPCKLCDVRCGDKQELRRHEAMHARKQQTKDVYNDKVRPIILERHNHIVYKCPECAIIFTKQRVYFRHIQGHKIIRNEIFKCDSCGKCCTSKKNLSAHIARHRAGDIVIPTQLDNLRFECPECGKKFPKQRYLIQHVQRHEAIEKGTFQCKVCTKFFGTRDLLIRHELTHGGKDTVEELKCSECDLICSSKHSLASHLRRHDSKRKGTFECGVCGKKMGSNCELESHTSKHAEKQLTIGQS